LEALGAELRDLLPDERPAEIDLFMKRMPRGYLLATPAEQAARHFPLLRGPVGAHEVRTLSGPGARPGPHALTVIASDRPGLLSWIAGSLSLAGLSILTAQVFTTDDGVAPAVVRVGGAFVVPLGEARPGSACPGGGPGTQRPFGLLHCRGGRRARPDRVAVRRDAHSGRAPPRRAPGQGGDVRTPRGGRVLRQGRPRPQGR